MSSRFPKTPVRRICLLAAPESQILDIAGPLEVFAKANRFVLEEAKTNRPPYEIQLLATEPELAIRCNNGLSLLAQAHYAEVRGAVDTLLIAGGEVVEAGGSDKQLLAWLRRMARRVRRLGSICTGAYLLAEAGLLDGRRATTHWGWCQDLAQRYPAVRLETDPIFVRDGNVYTSAGVTAGMDMALAMVEADHGAALALRIARHLVVFLRRPGNQSQFSTALAQQMADREPLRELQTWLIDHLHLPLTNEMLAERVGMSPRNFARVFAQQVGVTPARFIEQLRVEAARRRLEESPHGIEQIAAECGFGNTETLRSAFQRRMGVSPQQYRKHFQNRSERREGEPL